MSARSFVQCVMITKAKQVYIRMTMTSILRQFIVFLLVYMYNQAKFITYSSYLITLRVHFLIAID